MALDGIALSKTKAALVLSAYRALLDFISYYHIISLESSGIMVKMVWHFYVALSRA